MEDDPRVFDIGAMTSILTDRGFRLYVGAVRLEYVASFSATFVNGIGKVMVTFEQASGPDECLKIEEYIRLAETIPWIGII